MKQSARGARRMCQVGVSRPFAFTARRPGPEDAPVLSFRQARKMEWASRVASRKLSVRSKRRSSIGYHPRASELHAHAMSMAMRRKGEVPPPSEAPDLAAPNLSASSG